MRRVMGLLSMLLFFSCTPAYAGFGDSLFRKWIINPIQSFLMHLLAQAVEGVTKWISRPTNLYEYEFVATSIEVTQYLGFSLLAVSALKEIIQSILSHSAGDGGKSMQTILVDTVKSALLIGLSVWILQTMILVNNQLVAVISEAGKFSMIKMEQAPEEISLTENLVLDATNTGKVMSIGGFLLMSVVILIFALGLLALAVMAAFRYGQLVVLAILAPLLAVSVSGRKTAYQTWIKESVAVVFTQSFQIWMMWLITSIILKNSLMKSVFELLNFWNYLVAIGVLFMVICAPSVLKSYLHNSGVGGGVTNAAKFGAYRAMMPKMPKLK